MMRNVVPALLVLMRVWHVRQILRKDFPHADSVTIGEGVVMMTSRQRGLVQLYSIDTILTVSRHVVELPCGHVDMSRRRHVASSRSRTSPAGGA